MRNVVDRILEGDFQPETRALDFSCSKIEISMQAGEDYEGTFEIYGAVKHMTEGYVSTSSLEMECLTGEFAGTISEIAFCFHATNVREGEVRQGEFIIISNHGEYTIPYIITIVPKEIQSSLGTIKNLFHFTNLAKSNWEEAVNLFYSPDFRRLFHGADRQYYNIYKGLSGICGSGSTGAKTEQNVEEFLLAVKKKQRIEYIVSEPYIKIEDPRQLTEYTLAINRNGWGYTELKIEWEGDFIRIEKEIIREEDFLGNYYRLQYFIVSDRLHAGRNPGKIRLYNAYTDILVPVTVLRQNHSIKAMSLRREQKHNQLELMEYYVAFRTRKIGASTWKKETEKLIEKMIAFNENDIAAKLFRAQLLITQERFNEANWMLDHADVLLQEEKERDPVLWCYYQYLTTLHSGEEKYIDAIAEQVEYIFNQNRENWRIAWLLAYLLEDYGKNPYKKWMLLEEQFRYNCTSPVIYIEAFHLLQLNPTLLMKLEPFEIQVLLYAAKKEMLTKELVGQIVYLISKSKEYTEVYFKIIKECYKADPSDEVVKAICSLLIKGNKTGTEYFEWYKLGVEKELRVTRLFEYYIMSVNLDSEEKLPKMVLMYFAFNSDLDYMHNSYLYANVHKYQKDFPELYENYKEQIERFVMQQMAKGHINKWLAYLYKNVITPGMITEDNAEGLVKALFHIQVTILRENIRHIIVIYDKGQTEILHTVTGRHSYISLYGSDYHVFLEDSMGNRYAGEENYRLEKFIWPDKLAKMAAPLVRRQIGFDLWRCESGKEIASVTEDNLEAMERVLDTAYLAKTYQREMKIKLIRYFYDNDYIENLDRCLEGITVDQVESRNYSEVLKLLILRFRYEEAFKWMKEVGGIGIDAKMILRVLSGLMAEGIVCESKSLTVLAHMAFLAGKYNEKLLEYLACYYTGTTRQLRDIWKAAKAFALDTYRLDEKIMVQMLYTGSYVGEQMEIFKDYVSSGGKANLEMAFLAQCAYDYFVNDQITGVFIIKQMERVLERQEELSLVCKLAFIKYFSENKEEIDDNVRITLSRLLLQLVDQNIFFPFYREYIEIIPFMEQFLDKTIIEYRARPGNKAMIHYLIEKDTINKSEYSKEEMKHMFGGVCVKQFILFFGEQLLYYITEVEDEKEHLTESASISKSDITGDQKECKFSQINDIEIARTLQDYEAVDSLLYEFYGQEFAVEQLFHLR